MTAVAAKLLADLRRRRLQGGVIALIVLLASGTAALALTLRTAAANPYDRAFAEQRGAHLMVVFDGRVVAPDRLARTPRLLGASAWAGPWPTTGINVRATTGSGRFSLNLQGRADPGGDVERLRLAAGRWLTGPGQIVLTRSLAEQQGLSPGDRLVDLDVPTRPALEVVGEVIDVDEGQAGLASQSAWVLPAQVAPLVGQGHYLGYRMAYRLPGRPTQADLRRATARLEAALPAGAVSDTMPYLEVRKLFTLINTIILTFLLAFSVFALGAAAAVTANVVAGAVLASYRDVGIMKALGYTPAQVVGTLTGAMLVPALAGSVVGIPLGTLLAQPLLGRSSHALGLPSRLAFSPAVDLLTLAGVLVVVTAAAMLPALRAGRLSPVRVLALGAGPERSGNPRTRRPRRRLGPARRRPGPPGDGRLGLPRPLSLGAADAFARPLRATLTATAVLIGVATVTFAFGQHRSLDRFHKHLATTRVQVQRTAAYPDRTLMHTLLAQPETAGVVATSSAYMLVPGLADPVLVKAFRGNPTDLGVPLVTGRWYAGPGEVVVPNGLLQQTHRHVGDPLTVTFRGRAIPLRIVGSDFDVSNFGRDLSVDWSTLARVVPNAQPLAYLVRLRPAADPAAYARRIQATAPDLLSTQASSPIVSLLGIFDLVGLTLVVVLAGIAVAGIFATVLLNTRERLHDTAVLKVLGMTPRQVLAMATASACTLGLAGGVLGVPAGIALHQAVETLAGSVIGNRIPAVTLQTFPLLVMPALALTGVLLAMVGALLPAWWAARGTTVEPLRAE